MTVTHHIPEGTLRAYAAGQLPHPFAVVVAAHVSICADCRAQLEAEEALAGPCWTAKRPPRWRQTRGTG